MKNPDFNRRRQHRLSAKSGAIVAIRPIPELLGEMIDIGLGGLAFRYIQSDVTPQDTAELVILLPNRKFCLDRIPCRPVSDIPLFSDNSFSSLPMRRCSIAFGHLSVHQQLELERFILEHTQPFASQRSTPAPLSTADHRRLRM
jgi:hypothetical protein